MEKEDTEDVSWGFGGDDRVYEDDHNGEEVDDGPDIEAANEVKFKRLAEFELFEDVYK